MADAEEDSSSGSQRADRERFRQREIQEAYRVSAPVAAELTNAGFPVRTVGELYNRRMNYEAAIPILLRWLPRVDNDAVKEDIVRALSVKWAKPWAARPLVEEYRKANDPTGWGLKWAIGSALEVVADDSVFDEIVEMVRDRQHGKAREMLALALGKMRDPRAVDVLIELLDDEQVAGHAILALGKLKPVKATAHLEKFLADPRSWVRNSARRTLSRIKQGTGTSS